MNYVASAVWAAVALMVFLAAFLLRRHYYSVSVTPPSGAPRRYIDTLVFIPSNQTQLQDTWQLDDDIGVGRIIVALAVNPPNYPSGQAWGNLPTFEAFRDAAVFGNRPIEYWLRLRDFTTPETEDVDAEIASLSAKGFDIKGLMVVQEVNYRENWWQAALDRHLQWGLIGGWYPPGKGWLGNYPTGDGIPQPDIAVGEAYEPYVRTACDDAAKTDVAQQASDFHANAQFLEVGDSDWKGISLGGTGATCPTDYGSVSAIVRRVVDTERAGRAIGVMGLWS